MPNRRGNSGSRVYRGFGMRRPRFPTYTSYRVRNDVQFFENPSLDGNGFWVGQFDAADTTKNVQPKPEVNRNQTRVPSKEAQKAAAKGPQKQQVVSQPQSSGVPGAPNNSNPTKGNKGKRWTAARRRERELAAAKDPQKQQVVSQPQSSGVPAAAKNPEQNWRKRTKADRKRERELYFSTLTAAANNTQNQQVVSQPQSSGAGNPQQQNQPGVSKQPHTEVTRQKQTGSQNGGMKKRAAAKTRDADVRTQPPKKLMTEKMPPPLKKPQAVKNYGWRGGDVGIMYSCDLCQYHTPDSNQSKKHFAKYRHKEILRHLLKFFPKQRVDFLQAYLAFKRRKMFMEQTKKNIPHINDKFRGISERQFFHRVKAAHCKACDVLIPDVKERLQEHVRSAGHIQNRQATFWNIKNHSSTVAAELFQDADICEMLEQFNKGQDPFKDLPLVSSTNKAMVNEEADNYDDEDARDDPEETKGSDKKRSLPNESVKIEPATSSTTATSCSTKRKSLTERLQDKYISQIRKKYRMGQDPFKTVAVRTPHVTSTNEVLVAEEDDDDEEETEEGEDAAVAPGCH